MATAGFDHRGQSSVVASRDALPPEIEATYSLTFSQTRNHQAFSMRTKAAYGWRCAFSGLLAIMSRERNPGGRARRREGRCRECASLRCCLRRVHG